MNKWLQERLEKVRKKKIQKDKIRNAIDLEEKPTTKCSTKPTPNILRQN